MLFIPLRVQLKKKNKGKKNENKKMFYIIAIESCSDVKVVWFDDNRASNDFAICVELIF